MHELKQSLIKIGRKLQKDEDLDAVMERIGDARIVLLGEASHGTSEYYHWRSRLSRRLVMEKGFSFIAVEGDWPQCYLVNRYIKNYPNSGKNAREVLFNAFDSWPTWMWANVEMIDLIEWLRAFNSNFYPENKIGFYGLDVYSLWESLEAVTDYLEKHDPKAAAVAKQAYRCFEPFGEDVEKYALSTALVPDSCLTEVVSLLQEVQKRSEVYQDEPESLFNLEQNALVTVDAERYYRTMILGGVESWNIRDHHMDETLERLMTFFGSKAKAIVWAHNTHIGDARATNMAGEGMVSLGQLVKEHQRREGVVVIGFGSYEGSVVAADIWGDQPKKMLVPPAMVNSWEDVLNKTFAEDTLIIFKKKNPAPMLEKRGQRAIGVVYNPLDERSNYTPTILPERYDVFLFLNKTSHLRPLHIPLHLQADLPETYPSGL